MQFPKASRLLAAGATSVLLAIGTLTAAVAAGPGDQVRIRGTVVSLSGDRLQVNSREGKPVTVTLKAGWKASAVVKANMSDIKPGDFVGIASLPAPKAAMARWKFSSCRRNSRAWAKAAMAGT